MGDISRREEDKREGKYAKSPSGGARPLFDEEPPNLYSEEVLLAQAAARSCFLLNLVPPSRQWHTHEGDRQCMQHTQGMFASSCSAAAMRPHHAVARAAADRARRKGGMPLLEGAAPPPVEDEQVCNGTSTTTACSREDGCQANHRVPNGVCAEVVEADAPASEGCFEFLWDEVGAVVGELEDVYTCLGAVTLRRLVWVSGACVPAFYQTAC